MDRRHNIASTHTIKVETLAAPANVFVWLRMSLPNLHGFSDVSDVGLAAIGAEAGGDRQMWDGAGQEETLRVFMSASSNALVKGF